MPAEPSSLMRKYFLPVFALAILTGFISFTTDPSSSLAQAFRVSDAAAIAQQIDNSINLTILDKDGNYSKSQAVMLLKDFMDQHPAKSFNLQHTGSSTQGSSYGIAELISTAGVSYRVTFVFKKSGDKQFLKELQITTSR